LVAHWGAIRSLVNKQRRGGEGGGTSSLSSAEAERRCTRLPAASEDVEIAYV
jgi:hypothetical protein